MSRLLAALGRLSILRFAVIGALGMPVDWVVLHAMIDAGLARDAARLIAWFCAASFTWLGNRYFTFAGQRAPATDQAAGEAVIRIGQVAAPARFAELFRCPRLSSWRRC